MKKPSAQSPSKLSPSSPEQATFSPSPPAANMSEVITDVSIVEDDVEAREMLAEWLNSTAQFRCVSAHADGLVALKELPAVAPKIVLMDINMPGVQGIECVRRLKPEMPDTQFLMLTVYSDTKSIFQALAAGATGYLLKRTSRHELLAALGLVQAGGSPISSGIARLVAQAFQQPAAPAVANDELSDRERQVLDLLSHGHPEKQIADRLKISQHTVHTYIRRIYEKLHVHSHAQAVAKYAGQSPT
jgi:DNA-binding NarL/FixJ family response regulator